MKKETKNWIKKSKEDFDTAEYVFKGGKLNAAGFYFQQAAEKALKSAQIENLGRFEKTHNLPVLAKSLKAPEEIIELCEFLTVFYVITRYPDSEEKINKKDIMKAEKASGKVIKWVEKILK